PGPSLRLGSGHAFSKRGNGPRWVNSPFFKGELRGIFLANGEYNFTKTSIRKIQKLELLNPSVET
ncbi:MAG: hypothetical protein ACREOR_02625, partial [Candidatus Binatia bacterium]